MILIYVVCKNNTEAKKIGLKLLKDRLIACYNSWPIASAYFWQNKIVKDKEMVLLLKTREKNYRKIENQVRKMHSYETPCIFSLKPAKIEKSYFKWLKEVTK